MKDNKFTALEVGALSSFIYKTFILIGGINLLLAINNSDIIISSIIGGGLGFFIIYCFIKLNKILPKYNIFQKVDFIFPKFFALLIKVTLILCVLAFSSFALYNISLFIQSAILNKVDLLPISILLTITTAYLASKGMNTLTKSSLICLFIFIIFELITIFFTIPNINSSKILPLFESPFIKTLTSSFMFVLLSTIPLFMLSIIPKDNIENKKKVKKYIRFFYIITTLYLIFNFILVLSVIDAKLAVSINYPELFILSKISMLNFFDRMEDLLSFKLILDSFFTIACALIYLKKGLLSIFRLKMADTNKYIIPIISIIIILLSNFMNLTNWLIPSLVLFFITNISVIVFYKIS